MKDLNGLPFLGLSMQQQTYLPSGGRGSLIAVHSV